MVAQTRHAAAPAKKRLTFHGQLAGKGVTTDALLKKLTTLHSQLAALDQETVETKSLETVRSELIHTSLLLHKDRGVKAYTACCLADILRLYAPEAPYTQNELRDIFQFFFRQLSAGFKGSDEPYYNQYFHLLESLSTVKSVVLVCDLPNAEEMLHDIFREMFIIAKRDFAKKVEMFMVDILVALIEESNTLPADVLELIMGQFMDKNAKIDQPAYRLAVQVCNTSSDRLSRHVSMYFGDLLISQDEEDEDEDNLRKGHDLVLRLHQSCPAVLPTVIPILEAELRAEKVNARVIATQTLGSMYADKGGPDLMRKYPAMWQAWLGRKHDISVQVRLKAIEATPALLPNLPEAKKLLEELLEQKLLDPDEKVRAATCKVFSSLDYETALRHISDQLLHNLAGRGLDKKRSVRQEALTSISKLFSLAYPEIENNDEQAIKQFAWIPDEVLKMASANTDVRALVDQVVAEYICPLPSISTSSATRDKEADETAWTNRLLMIMRFMYEKANKTLLTLAGLNILRPNAYDAYVDACVKNNGGIIDDDEQNVVKRLKISIQHLSGTFPDPVKASEDLHAFAKLNESRLYKLMKTCMDPQTDLKSLIKAHNEFIKRLEQLSSSALPTLTLFLYRSSYRIVNQSSIPVLLKRIQKAQNASNSAKAQAQASGALTLLLAISKNCPGLYRPHVGELWKGVVESVNVGRESGAADGRGKGMLAEVGLQALSSLNRKVEGVVPGDKKTIERVMRIALESDWRQAKFAARFLAFSKDKDTLCEELVESISQGIGGKGSIMPVAHIAALTQIVKFVPKAFEAKSDVIIQHLVKKVLMVPIFQDPDDPDAEEEWVEDAEIPDDLRSKILALKVCRNRCLAAKADQALEIATPVLKMLVTLIENDGLLDPTVEENVKVKARLRLQAAVSLLHLSTIDNFATAIQPKFVRLACVVQDTCFNIRFTFLQKLLILLQQRKLGPKFNTIPFMTVLDPEDDVKNLAASYVENAKRRMIPSLRLEYLEIIFIRLLHLLAHHPDFATSQEDILDMAQYVHFYLDLVATSENISLLYHLATKGKTVRDAESHAYSENFYMMCEIAQILIKGRAQAHSWLLPSYPGKVKLPADILKPLPSAEAATQILKTVYLPSDAVEWLNERFKLGSAKEKKERREKEKERKDSEKEEKKESKEKKRKVPPTKANGHTKRTRRKRGSDDEEEDQDEGGQQRESDVEMEDAVSSPKSHPTHRNGSGGKQSRAERLSARTRAKEREESPTSES